jgi:hypothetical protein
MHIKKIMAHQRLSLIRSTVWKRRIGVRILFAFAISYMLFNLIFLGLVAGKLIREGLPGTDPVYVFSMGILFFVVCDLVLRFFFQPHPRLQIAPYLHLNIPKTKLADILIVKSFYNIFNVYALVLVISFALKEVWFDYSLLGAWGYIVGFLLLICMNNLLSLLLKTLSQDYYYLFAFPVIAILALFGLQHFKILDITALSASLGMSFMKPSLTLPLLALIVMLLWILNKKVLIPEMYLDRLTSIQNNKQRSEVSEVGFISNLSGVGKFISLELKLIARNKRPRTLAFMAFFFAFYFIFILLKTSANKETLPFVIFSVFMSSPFLLMHGQFMFNWESSYFDFLMSKNISLKTYLKAKYYLFLASSAFIILIIGTILFVQNYNYLLFLSVGLFTIGFYAFLMFLMATYNKSRIDLNKSAFLNYEGTSAIQFLFVFVAILIPVVLFYSFKFFVGISVTCFIMSAIGLLFILAHKKWIAIVADEFMKRKYVNLDGFRK